MNNREANKYLTNCSDDVFLIDEGGKFQETYATFYNSATSIASYLLAGGLQKGDRVVVILDNSIFLAKFYFACLYAGIIVVPVHPASTSEQIQFILLNSQASLLLTTPSYLEKINNLTTRTMLINDGSEKKISGYNFEVYEAQDLEKFDRINPNDYLDPSNIAIIIYTSGTTALPKGVVHTVSDLVQNGLIFINSLHLNQNHRFFNLLPMTYLGGYYNLLLVPYLAKSSVVISQPFSPSNMIGFWDSIIKHKVNTLWLVPTIIALLMEIDRSCASADYCKNHIIMTLVGTAPLSQSLKKSFESKYRIKIYENYGLSETLFIATEEPNTSSKGVGKVLPGISLQILNNKNEILGLNEEGEIAVQTSSLMKGYLGSDEIFDKSKLFQTGDMGYLDAENNLYITGRKKDLIIKGGVNISPASIEEVICKNPQVQECAVVGVPHSLSGEEIIAVIKTKSETQFSELKKQLLATCKQKLASIQIPSDIIQIEELPHTFTGKIQKSRLRAWLVDHKKSTKKTVHQKIDFFQPSHLVENALPALSITYNTMVYELQSQNIDVTVLSLGEAFFDLPIFDFNSLPYPASYHYSHSRGIPKLRHVLADYFQGQYDVKFDPEHEIILTAGSKIAIYMALLALINPGDEVVIHDPSWVSYPEQVKLCQGVPICIPYNEDIFAFEKYISNRTKVLIINNPNNPRGSTLTLDEIAHLYKLAEKYNLYILSDEAYSDFVINKEQFISIGNFDKEFKFSLICNSISKNFGISGWRIGYVIANKKLINQILKLNQHLITCPPTILQHYIANHFYEILKFTQPQIKALLIKRQKIVDYINSIQLDCLDGNTTFYIFLSIGKTHLSSEEFCKKLLAEHHICVVPGIGYGKSCDKFVRVSIGTESLERIFKAMDTIKQLILDTSKKEINKRPVSLLAV